MSFDLGTIKFKMQITPDGRCILSIDIVDDKLTGMFPIKDALSLGMSKGQYKRYVNDILRDKENWIREHIPEGIYTQVIRVTDTDLTKEDA